MAAKRATPKDPSSQHGERHTHLAQDLYSTPSSTVVAKLDLSQSNRDTSLPDDVDPTTESSVHSNTRPDPAHNRPLVDSEINEEPSQPYRSQILRALCEYEHPVTKYRQAQIAPSFTASHEYSVFPSVSYTHHQQRLCRWLYETSDENMTMAEILEKSNWEEQRLEKL